MKRHEFSFLILFFAAALPLPLRAQVTETYAFSSNRLAPDGNFSGLADVRVLNSAIAKVTSVTVGLNIVGEYNGDLYAYLVHSNGFVTLLNRPGRTAANPFGYADSGFNVTFQDGAPNGDIHLYENVTTPPPGVPATGTWQPDGRKVDPSSVLDSSARTSGLTNLNGLNASGPWTLFLADLESGGTNELTQWSLTISGQGLPSLTWSNPPSIVYGTALGSSQLGFAATFNSTNLPGTWTYTNSLGAALSAATVLPAGIGQVITVTFMPADGAAFLPVSSNFTVNVTPAPVTVSQGLAAVDKIYDGTTTAALNSNNVVLSGVLASDLGEVSLVTNDYAAVFASRVAADGVAVAVSGLGLAGSAAGNYLLTQPALTANISAKALAMSGLTVPASKVYDGTTTAVVSGTSILRTAETPGSGSTADGAPYIGDDVVIVGVPTGSYDSSNVASARSVSFGGLSLGGAQAGDYSLTIQADSGVDHASPDRRGGGLLGQSRFAWKQRDFHRCD